ncbi:MAG: hypothetical protein J2P31_19595 [Blastocatellia bacterium]|nr:hypothetical protein [Blastocatellia bacterium]
MISVRTWFEALEARRKPSDSKSSRPERRLLAGANGFETLEGRVVLSADMQAPAHAIVSGVVYSAGEKGGLIGGGATPSQVHQAGVEISSNLARPATTTGTTFSGTSSSGPWPTMTSGTTSGFDGGSTSFSDPLPSFYTFIWSDGGGPTDTGGTTIGTATMTGGGAAVANHVAIPPSAAGAGSLGFVSHGVVGQAAPAAQGTQPPPPNQNVSPQQYQQMVQNAQQQISNQLSQLQQVYGQLQGTGFQYKNGLNQLNTAERNLTLDQNAWQEKFKSKLELKVTDENGHKTYSLAVDFMPWLNGQVFKFIKYNNLDKTSPLVQQYYKDTLKLANQIVADSNQIDSAKQNLAALKPLLNAQQAEFEQQSALLGSEISDYVSYVRLNSTDPNWDDTTDRNSWQIIINKYNLLKHYVNNHN